MLTTGNAVAYVIDVEFVWGYQATIAGLTKSPPPYTYPPPTTVLGAIAEAIARSEGLGENSLPTLMSALTKDLVAVALRPVNCIPVRYQDINRVIAIRQTGKDRYPSSRDLQGSFDAPARGKTILASLNGKPPTIEWVLVWRRNPVIKVPKPLTRPSNVPLSPKHLWRLHRIGSKESLASVTRVLVKEVKALPQGSQARTRFSFPLEALSKYEPRGRWVVEAYADPFKPYAKGESPALRYLRGESMSFALPVLAASGDEPVAFVRPSRDGVLLEVEEVGTVVGVIKG